MGLLAEAIEKIKEAQVFMDEENTSEFRQAVKLELGAILEQAQGHNNEEISYSEVVRVLLDLARDNLNLTAATLGKIVYEETV